MTNVLQVLTYKSVETVLAVGGTQSWALDRNRAIGCRYAVLCRNANSRDTEGNEAHGSAFMVGKISGVVPSTETPDRWLVLFSEYALVNVGEQWEGRNPVRFYEASTYEEIDFETLDWKVMPSMEAAPKETSGKAGLTIAEAKAGLAQTFGVDASAIKITIEG